MFIIQRKKLHQVCLCLFHSESCAGETEASTNSCKKKHRQVSKRVQTKEKLA